MVCTSYGIYLNLAQGLAGKTDFERGQLDGVGLEPVGDRTLDEAGVRLDLGQLDGLVLPLRSNRIRRNRHRCDQSQGQNKYDNLSHIFLTFFVGSTTQMDGAFVC